MCPALHSLLLWGERSPCLPVRQKNREHGLLAGSVGAASSPPLCSRACVGDNVDNEGRILARGEVRAHTHTYRGCTSPRPRGAPSSQLSPLLCPRGRTLYTQGPPSADVIDVT